MTRPLSRRSFLSIAGVAAASGLTGCASFGSAPAGPVAAPEPQPDANLPQPLAYYKEMYGPIQDGQFLVPAIPIEKVDPRFYRQEVRDPTGERPGTIVVDTPNRYLYLVMDNGQALRYGVGIGREGFAWEGNAQVQWKQKWPKWTPPDDMIARQPELEKYSAKNGGMPGGVDNPLGARALYMFENGKDTLYRIHGSPEWWSIGHAVSSGCVRLMDQDIIDLYGRVPVHTPVHVIGGSIDINAGGWNPDAGPTADPQAAQPAVAVSPGRALRKPGAA